MELYQCIENRMSYRAFLPKEVDKGILERILRAANRSPSYRNSQPWEVFVVSGEKKDALVKRLCEVAASGTTPSSPLPVPAEWPQALERRMKEHSLARFEAIGIDPKNEEQVREMMLGNLRFYGAPCVIFVGMDEALTAWSAFDLGSLVHCILLGLEAEGLGGCPQASVTGYGHIIREVLDITNNTIPIIAIALGYPDPEASFNKYHSQRKEMNEFVHWYGF